MKKVTQKLIDVTLPKMTGVGFKNGKANAIASYIRIYLGGRLPAELADLIKEYGGKAKEADRIGDLLHKATGLVYADLKVEVADGEAMVVSPQSPLMQYEIEEPEMPRKKVNATPATTKKRGASKKKEAAAPKSTAAASKDHIHYTAGEEPGERQKALVHIFNFVKKVRRKSGVSRADIVDDFVSNFEPPRATTVVDKNFASGYISHAVKTGVLKQV